MSTFSRAIPSVDIAWPRKTLYSHIGVSSVTSSVTFFALVDLDSAMQILQMHAAHRGIVPIFIDFFGTRTTRTLHCLDGLHGVPNVSIAAVL